MLKKNEQKNEYCFPNYETEQIKEAFDIFDINRNGYIGVDELKEIFTIINEEVSEEELNEMIGLADKEGDGQVNWLNFYEFINGNAISEEIKKMKRIDDIEEIEYDDKDEYKKSKNKFKLIGENYDSQKNSNLNESINDSNMNSNNISNADSNFSKKKNLDDSSFKKKKVSHFKYKDNSFNESNNKSNDSENENYNINDNNDNENNNIFDEVDDEKKKKDDEKQDNFIAEMLKKKK